MAHIINITRTKKWNKWRQWKIIVRDITIIICRMLIWHNIFIPKLDTYPLICDYKAMVQSNLLMNILITIEGEERAADIYGAIIAALEGNMVRANTDQFKTD